MGHLFPDESEVQRSSMRPPSAPGFNVKFISYLRQEWPQPYIIRITRILDAIYDLSLILVSFTERDIYVMELT